MSPAMPLCSAFLSRKDSSVDLKNSTKCSASNQHPMSQVSQVSQVSQTWLFVKLRAQGW